MKRLYTSIKTIDIEEKIFPNIKELSSNKDIIGYEFKKDLINKNDIKKSIKRNSGIDLIRIVDMYSIVIHHILLHGGLLEKYDKFKVLNLINIFCSWHITGFILISGMVGYRTCKYSNLIYLWLCVLFYSIGIQLFVMLFKPEFVIREKLIYSFFPLIFSKYWYFSKYFGLYLLLPVINKGIEALNQYEINI